MQNAISSIQHRRAGGKRTLSKLELREERVAYLFLLPWLLGVVILLAGPVIASIFISFTRWNFRPPPSGLGWIITGACFSTTPIFIAR